MSYAAKVEVMTTDPGARFLGAVADDLQSQIDVLTARLNDCCPSHSPARLAPAGDAKDQPSALPGAKVP